MYFYPSAFYFDSDKNLGERKCACASCFEEIPLSTLKIKATYNLHRVITLGVAARHYAGHRRSAWCKYSARVATKTAFPAILGAYQPRWKFGVESDPSALEVVHAETVLSAFFFFSSFNATVSLASRRLQSNLLGSGESSNIAFASKIQSLSGIDARTAATSR